MATVTVPSGGSTVITQTFDNHFNSQLALSIQAALQAALNSGNLVVETTDGSLAVPTIPSGKVGELVIEPGTTGNISIPASANYSFVVDNTLGPDTIFGSPGLSIMGGGGTHTIIDPDVITLGDTSTGSNNNITITGAGDNVAVGNGTNTLTGTGSGTMSGGTGKNEFVAGGQYVINSQGLVGDTIIAGGGSSTVNASGPNASIVGGGGELFATLGGNADSLFGGGGAAHVTITGGASSVVAAGSGAELSVLDLGTNDTIDAGSGSATVSAPGGSFVNGGAGQLVFVGGTGPSTLIGGSGASTVFGGAATTSIVGGANGATEYVNTTSGGLWFTGGNGNETIDASLSKGADTLFGGFDPAASYSLAGGAGGDLLTGGFGNTTLTGGGGRDGFYFWNHPADSGVNANNVISDFAANDYVLLGNYGAGAAAAAIAAATTANGSTTITLSDATKITFTGVTDPAALNGHIFTF